MSPAGAGWGRRLLSSAGIGFVLLANGYLRGVEVIREGIVTHGAPHPTDLHLQPALVFRAGVESVGQAGGGDNGCRRA